MSIRHAYCDDTEVAAVAWVLLEFKRNLRREGLTLYLVALLVSVRHSPYIVAFRIKSRSHSVLSHCRYKRHVDLDSGHAEDACERLLLGVCMSSKSLGRELRNHLHVVKEHVAHIVRERLYAHAADLRRLVGSELAGLQDVIEILHVTERCLWTARSLLGVVDLQQFRIVLLHRLKAEIGHKVRSIDKPAL